MKTREVNDVMTSSTLESMGKFSGLLLGVLTGLEVAEAAETILGKVVSIVGLTWLGGVVGKKAGKVLA